MTRIMRESVEWLILKNKRRCLRTPLGWGPLRLAKQTLPTQNSVELFAPQHAPVDSGFTPENKNSLLIYCEFRLETLKDLAHCIFEVGFSLEEKNSFSIISVHLTRR